MTLVAEAQVETSRYLAREAILSAVINAALSAGFFVLVFRDVDPVSVWGMGSYAFDFVPQSFAIGLMATLVPEFLCRRAIAQDRIAGLAALPAGPGSVAARAVINALLAVLVGAGLCALVLWAADVDALPYAPAFALKVLYGAVLGWLITRFALLRMLG